MRIERNDLARPGLDPASDGIPAVARVPTVQYLVVDPDDPDEPLDLERLAPRAYESRTGCRWLTAIGQDAQLLPAKNARLPNETKGAWS